MNNANGIKMTLLYMLEQLHTEYKLRSFVSHTQRDKFYEIYEAYHNLGGNGYDTILWHDVESMSVRDEEIEYIKYFCTKLMVYIMTHYNNLFFDYEIDKPTSQYVRVKFSLTNSKETNLMFRYFSIIDKNDFEGAIYPIITIAERMTNE